LPTWVTTMKVSVEVALRASSSRSSPCRLTSGRMRFQSQERRLVDVLDPALRARAGAHQLEHADLRDGETLARGLDDQRRDDGQGERDLDDEGGALAELRLELDGAADLLDVRTDHVHAHTTARDAGHLGCGRETCLKDELHHLLVGHGRDLGLGRQLVGHGLGADLVERQALPVVGDLDDNVAALVEGVERDAAGLGLARRLAVGGPLQAVIGAVAHQMGQRVLDQLEDLAVELGLGAEHLQVDLLVELVAQVAHQARQLGPGVADGLHARLHHAFLQLRGQVVQALQRRGEIGVLLGTHDLQQLVAGEHQLADHGHQVLEHVDADADALRGDRGILGLGAGRRRRSGGGSRSRLRLDGLHGGRFDFGDLLDDWRGRGSRCGGRGRGNAGIAAFGKGVEALDQVAVLAGGLGLGLLQDREKALDAIQRFEDQADSGGRDGQLAIADPAEHVLAGVSDRFQPRQAEEAAGALDGVHDAEDVAEQLRIIRVLLEADEFLIEQRETLGGLGQKFAEEVVHGCPFASLQPARAGDFTRLPSRSAPCAKP